MTKQITVAAAMISRLGFSRKEAANAWGVREDTVKKWCSGKMAMPSEIEFKLRSQVQAWETTCRHIGQMYDEMFDGEPEIYFSFPDENMRKRVLLPESDGFLLNTLASVMANMESVQGMDVIPSEEVETSEVANIEEMAFNWLYSLDENSERLGYFGLYDTTIGAGEAILKVIRDLLESDPSRLSVSKEDLGWVISRHVDLSEDGLLIDDIEDTNNYAGLILFVTRLGEKGKFNFAYEGRAVVQVQDENGNRNDVGLVLPGKEWGGDTLALNLAVADILNDVFESTDHFEKWANSQIKIKPVLRLV